MNIPKPLQALSRIRGFPHDVSSRRDAYYG